MKKMSVKRTRPILVIIFICLTILFKSPSPLEFGEHLLFVSFLLLISFISIYIFQIKEEILIENRWHIFNQERTVVKIDTAAIVNVLSHDCWNKVMISTDTSEITLNIQSFNSKKVEKFFIENEVFKHVQVIDKRQ